MKRIRTISKPSKAQLPLDVDIQFIIDILNALLNRKGTETEG